MTDASAGITVSVVSHGQRDLAASLLVDLAACPDVARVVVTQNIPEAEIPVPAGLATRVVRIANAQRRGYGENHNAAFAHCATDYFCVLNPDIRLPTDPFGILRNCLEEQGLALVAPMIVDPDGKAEDSAREFPTIPRLFHRRVLGGADARVEHAGEKLVFPDWIAGMFMLFSAAGYRRLAGFDEGYFLYVEDTDLCYRARQSGLSYAICTEARAVHHARRHSRRQLKYMYWHANSMIRFLWRSGMLFAAPPATSRNVSRADPTPRR